MDQNHGNATSEQETLFNREVAGQASAGQAPDRQRHAVSFQGDEVKFIESWRQSMEPGASFADAARAALAEFVEARGKVAVAEDAGIGTRALNAALNGDPVKPGTATNLLAVVARENAKGAKTR